jgi:hypothetical protein
MHGPAAVAFRAAEVALRSAEVAAAVVSAVVASQRAQASVADRALETSQAARQLLGRVQVRLQPARHSQDGLLLSLEPDAR